MGVQLGTLGTRRALVPFASMHGRISGVVTGRCAFPGGQLFLYSINIASKYKEPTGLRCCGRPQASFTDAHLARSHERNFAGVSETRCKNTTKPNRTIQTRSCFGPERSGIALTCCSVFYGEAKRSHRTPSSCEQGGRHVTRRLLLCAVTPFAR